MPDRRRFLTAVASTGAAVMLSKRVQAASPAPAPPPAVTPSPKPSGEALRMAEGMRAFDPTLTAGEITNIAQQIDDNVHSGKGLNPKAKRLKNSDEPVTILRVQP
ncbi:MAG: hypothetical protein NVS1B14_06190 [Vulcanimicrobiaceae bacterium]